jgi:hypothetical protein
MHYITYYSNLLLVFIPSHSWALLVLFFSVLFFDHTHGWLSVESSVNDVYWGIVIRSGAEEGSGSAPSCSSGAECRLGVESKDPDAVRQQSSDGHTHHRHRKQRHSSDVGQSTVSSSSASAVSSTSSSGRPASQKPYRVSLDTIALAEASRNLTQTLRQFSSEVFKTAASQVGPLLQHKFESLSGRCWSLNAGLIDVLNRVLCHGFL